MSNETKKTVNTKDESEWDIRNPFRKFNFPSYLKEELVQSTRKQQENSGTEDRGPFNNRVYTFVTVPQHFESFMGYGLLQCLDHLLVIYTFLPVRCILTALKLIFYCLKKLLMFPNKMLSSPSSIGCSDGRLVYSHEIRDIIRFSLLIICTMVLVKVDTSVVYHEIRTQSVIKIYIFFNLLEVADRLLSAVCQDALDDLLHTASILRHTSFRLSTIKIAADPTRTSEGAVVLVRDLVLQYCFALICLLAHCFLLLCQVTTLNVAFNSQNKSLVTVFISNNFVELKGNVFRKMGKTNLFQIACADVRERFHYAVWLFIVICRNMTDTGWNWDDLWAMLYDVFFILLAEVAVDWVKHSFITKFNVIPSNVYKEYTVSIAYDLLLCRQGKNTADYYDLLSRRMGLTPIPLSCLINVMLLQTVRNPSYLLFMLPFSLLVLFPIKILANMTLLSLAYSRVKAYIKAESAAQVTELFGKSDDAVATETVKQETTEPRKNQLEDEVIQQDHPIDMKAAVDPNVHSTPMRIFSFEQPTRDEDHFVPMVLRHRRVRSDSDFASSPTPIPPVDMDESSATTTVQSSSIQRPASPVPMPIIESTSSKQSSEWWSPLLIPAGDEPPMHINGEHGERDDWGTGSVQSYMNESEVSLSEYLQLSDAGKNNSTLDDWKTESPVFDRIRQVNPGTDSKPGSDKEEIPLPSTTTAEQLRSSQPVTVSSLDASGQMPRVVPVFNFDTNVESRSKVNVRNSTHQRTRCYSIDLGVLSGFSRRTMSSDAEPVVTTNVLPGMLADGSEAVSTNVDKSAQTEQFVRRRRHRTQTECLDQPSNPRSSQKDDLPAMWERSSRNSVVQPFDINRLRIKQPLSDIDRYSMIEGQIS